MSGGYWQYKSDEIEMWSGHIAEAMELIAAAEHELDWGLSGDTCHQCARIRVGAAVEALLEGWYGRSDAKMNWSDIIADQTKRSLSCTSCRATRAYLVLD